MASYVVHLKAELSEKAHYAGAYGNAHREGKGHGGGWLYMDEITAILEIWSRRVQYTELWRRMNPPGAEVIPGPDDSLILPMEERR